MLPFRILNIELTCDLAISLLGIYPKELKAGTQTDTCLLMFIAVLFIITKRWEQPKWPSMDKWINKMRPIHTMEYYSASKRKEILTLTTTWINLEDIMLSGISPS